MTGHININQINSNFRYRFDYLSKFLNFTSNDIAMLNKFAIIFLSHIPVIVDTVYRKLLSFDITKQYFLIRNDSFEDPLTKKSTDLTLESAQMIYRKDMLSIYLNLLLTQIEWNDTFLQYLSRIEKIHTNKAGSLSINVDYIHIYFLWTIENLDNKNKYGVFIALNKLFWIQNDFFSIHYLTSWNEKSNSNDLQVKTTKYCCF
ncbi:unnamed protein product [Rotaria sordida]|uniref:Globin-sensor domain-containing protein n=1 Tax=Rotaria sordida TaxID=392033 RepID=A0A819VMU1_9BILA|nr:unnamed protein product [Rotaria sordida]CAF4110425.1 unnamed protein product [Rotaria sordida]